MYKLEDNAFLSRWSAETNPDNAPALIEAGGQLLHALVALDAALPPRSSELPPGEANPLARLIVQHYGPIYAHDVLATDVSETAFAALGG